MSFARKMIGWMSMLPFVLPAPAGAPPAPQLGLRSAGDWKTVLERPERVDGLKIAEVVAALTLRPGSVVADVGAGTGVFSLPLARAVGPSGTVLAGDIDQELLDLIQSRARAEGLENIRTVLGEFEDPRLDPGGVQVAFLHDVLHHIQGREAYLRKLSTYLEDSGRIVIIDYDTAGNPDAPHQDQPEMQITLEQVQQWMERIGFALVREHALFEDKFFVEFARSP